MPDLDLLELLCADHVNLTEDIAGPDVVAAVEKHLTAERALLYPLVESHLADGDAVADQLRAIDKDLVDALSDQGVRSAGSTDVVAALRAHVDAQESHFADLRQSVSALDLVERAEELTRIMEAAPTRLHPRLPDHGPLRGITSDLAAEADQIRDRF